MDLVVFPEYALHGLSMDTNPAIMCRMDGPEVAAFRQACVDNRIWGCFSIMEHNPRGNPYNVGLIIDDARRGQALLPQDAPLGAGRALGARRPRHSGHRRARTAPSSALIICHDGMFPEMARECAYKGAEIMIRTAGYTAPIRDSWRFTNQSNAFCNLMVTANVCMCGSDGTFDSMGEGMVVNFDGSVIAHGTSGPRRRDHHRRGAAGPRARGAHPLGRREQHLPVRPSRLHGGEGRRRDCPYTYMHDLAAGRYRLPWEDEVKVTDGTSCGFPAPTRRYGAGRMRRERRRE